MFVKFRFTSARQHPPQHVCKPLMARLIDDCSLLDISTHTHTHTHMHGGVGGIHFLRVVCEQMQLKNSPPLLGSSTLPRKTVLFQLNVNCD
jgi:hypothetical protein